jgi:hypothetical protein
VCPDRPPAGCVQLLLLGLGLKLARQPAAHNPPLHRCRWLSQPATLPAAPSSVNRLDRSSSRYYAFTVYRISVSVQNRKNIKSQIFKTAKLQNNRTTP